MANSKPAKIIFMPHANIQYSQLRPDRRAWVVNESYGKLFDVVDSGDYKIAFEASGETIKFMAESSPKIAGQLKRLIGEKKIEPVGSPFTHIMISNIDADLCLATLKDGLNAWERYIGVRPVVGWNPECGWASYVPDIYKAAGFQSLVMDADSFYLSFAEIRKATGLVFDVRGHSNKNHLFKIEDYIKDKPEFLSYLTNPSVMPNGLVGIFRSDMMSNYMLWYLMGATEGCRQNPINTDDVRQMLISWKDRVQETGTFIMPYAEDAEYIGTTAYFYVKQFGQARFFEHEPQSVTRFKEMLDMAMSCGYIPALPSEVIAASNPIDNKAIVQIENGVAWHGGTAKAWANTKYARIMDPICRSIAEGIRAIAALDKKSLQEIDGTLKAALEKVISALVSDSRWPPDPTSPGRFNVNESLNDMRQANDLIAKAMEERGIASQKYLYSPDLMKTQIEAIAQELMAKSYFGE
ncbi:MAG: glycoside hydrolase family 57 [Phycisphaerae bacterium]